MTQYIQQQGYEVIELYECEWLQMKRTNPAINTFLQEHVKRPLDDKKTMTQAEVLEAIKTGQLFGLVQCDLHVPPALEPHFQEMPPIFKNVEVGREDIGDYMRQYAEEHHLLTQPRRSLIGSMKGEKILLATPLLQWYLTHGLEVTHIYQTVEYTPKDCFKPFGDMVSDARRAGDADPNKKLVAETMKLIGNSGYGKTVTNKSKHKNVLYCGEASASRHINDPLFHKLDPVNDDESVHEVHMHKKTIVYDLPHTIGFFVYQYAKMRMLEFYFDFMVKFVDPKDFQYCEMDTDSAYMALSAATLEEIIKPHMLEQYHQEKHLWFPREGIHAAYDKRTPGLFKVEWEGNGIIGLCSKTYYCFGQQDKLSCKGLNKRQNAIQKEDFLNVLRTKQPGSGVNRGFRTLGTAMVTYTQEKDALSYFYPKRKVLSDGVTTQPLDV